jgi:mono/diheme cytochrome c family protein
MIRTVVLVSIVTMLSAALLAACQTSNRALALIEQNKCRDCHTLKGKGGSSAPNLTTVGARRDRTFIYQQIKAPKTHNPNTDMPSFGDRIPEQDLNILADYLSGMK